jgi:hypothetical protein
VHELKNWSKIKPEHLSKSMDQGLVHVDLPKAHPGRFTPRQHGARWTARGVHALVRAPLGLSHLCVAMMPTRVEHCDSWKANWGHREPNHSSKFTPLKPHVTLALLSRRKGETKKDRTAQRHERKRSSSRMTQLRPDTPGKAFGTRQP